MSVDNSFKDQAKRRFWEKYASGNRKNVRTKQILDQHGPVKRICIRCKKNQITPRMPKWIKLCKECYEKENPTTYQGDNEV